MSYFAIINGNYIEKNMSLSPMHPESSGRLFNVCKDFKKTSFGRNFAQWVIFTLTFVVK